MFPGKDVERSNIFLRVSKFIWYVFEKYRKSIKKKPTESFFDIYYLESTAIEEVLKEEIIIL